MKAHIVLTDEQGRVYEGEVTLTAATRASASRPKKVAVAKPSSGQSHAELDFGLPLRAFIKRYSNGLGGPQKFTLLLAHMAKGKAGVSVPFPDLKKQWNRMTGLMGGEFHNMYGARARDEAWVDTPRPGQYALRTNWADALGKT